MSRFLSLEDIALDEAQRLRSGSGAGGSAAAGEEARGFQAGSAWSPRLRVFDLHCDTLDRLALSGDPSSPGGFHEHDKLVPRNRMSSLGGNDAHISLERLSGFDWCQCFAIFIPDEVRGDDAWSFYLRVRNWAFGEFELERERICQVRESHEAARAFSQGRAAAMLTVEGAAFLVDDGSACERLDALTADGVRMVTLTWNGPNAIGSGHATDEGITPFGRSMIRELEARDIVVDVSHLNDEGFKDVCRAAEKPFAASHSNARSVCDHPRNLEDWQLREIAERGGIVGLNFCRNFLTLDRADPRPDDVLFHVDRILQVAGERVLALGSDYDGCDVPSWLEPCDRISGLHDLLESQFGREIAERIFYENAHDFFAR